MYARTIPEITAPFLRVSFVCDVEDGVVFEAIVVLGVLGEGLKLLNFFDDGLLEYFLLGDDRWLAFL